MRFREHRGSLADSMETMVELAPTMDALIAHLQAIATPWPTFPPINRHTVTVTEHTPKPDNRIGWPETRYVVLQGYGVLGMVDCRPGECAA